MPFGGSQVWAIHFQCCCLTINEVLAPDETTFTSGHVSLSEGSFTFSQSFPLVIVVIVHTPLLHLFASASSREEIIPLLALSSVFRRVHKTEPFPFSINLHVLKLRVIYPSSSSLAPDLSLSAFPRGLQLGRKDRYRPGDLAPYVTFSLPPIYH